MRLTLLAYLLTAMLIFFPLGRFVTAGDKPDDLPLFPLKKGLKWEFCTDGDEKVRWQVQVANIITFNKKQCYEIAISDASLYVAAKEDGMYVVGGKAPRAGPPARRGAAAKEDGMYVVGGKAGKGWDFAVDPPMCILKPSSNKTQSWEYDGHLRWQLPLFSPDAYPLKIAYEQRIDTIKYDGKDVEAVLVVSKVDKETTHKLWCLPGVGVIRSEAADGTVHVRVDISTDKPTVAAKTSKKVEVVFEEKVVDKEIFTEPIELVEGVVAEYTLEHKYEHSITKTSSTGMEGGVKGTVSVGSKLFFGSAELAAEVKAKAESSLGITIGKTETFTQKITVDGNKTPKLKVIWLLRYRQGTATLEDGTQEKFLVCVGVRWKLKKD